MGVAEVVDHNVKRGEEGVHAEHEESVPFLSGLGSKPTLRGGHLPLKSSTDNSHQALTKNEILCSRNEPEKFRLVAIVVVGEDGPRPPRYLTGYNFGEPVFAETATTFSLRKLLNFAGEPA